jgi:C4-type Zn-finger protein
MNNAGKRKFSFILPDELGDVLLEMARVEKESITEITKKLLKVGYFVYLVDKENGQSIAIIEDDKIKKVIEFFW